jgi:proteasome lid subunit RPN8/RPN11
VLEILQPDDVNERCGLVLKDGTIVELENVAEDPENSYEMAPESVLPFLEKDLVVSTWHTHPHTDPNLSGEDYAGFLGWPDLSHIILGMRNGKPAMVTYRVENGLVMVCN